MYKLKNRIISRYFLGRDAQSVSRTFGQQWHSHTSPLAGEVDTKCRVRGIIKQIGGTFLRFSASTRNVIRRRYSLLEVLRRRIHNVITIAMSICVALGNKVMDTRDWHSQQGVPPKYDVDSSVQYGRSMIEMLGVLAIIAVLSVGGIAGYSKAMEKWKINKTVEGYSYLITGLLEYIDDLRPLQHDNGTENDDFRYYLGNVIQGLNLVPEGWNVNSSGVFDNLGNFISVFTRREKIVFDIHLGATESVDQSITSMDFSDKICLELLNTAFQPLSSMLYRVFIFKSKTGYIHYYGDGYCGVSRKCLRTMTLVEMKQACQSCALGEDFCLLTVEF